MKYKYLAIPLFITSLLSCQESATAEKVASPSSIEKTEVSTMSQTIYDFEVPALSSGSSIKLSDYKGKYILIVNTASECGYTPQYKDLEALYQKYKDQLVIIGFPANNFGGQEPGSNEEIATFCEKNYGVSFPMAAKVSVKGDDQAALYQYLTQKSKNGVMDIDIKWNFHKILIDKTGKIVSDFPSSIKPMDEALTKNLL